MPAVRRPDKQHSATRFRSVFYTPKKPSDAATCKALASLLGEKHIGAKKCDVVERARKPFSAFFDPEKSRGYQQIPELLSALGRG